MNNCKDCKYLRQYGEFDHPGDISMRITAWKCYLLNDGGLQNGTQAFKPYRNMPMNANGDCAFYECKTLVKIWKAVKYVYSIVFK